MRIFEVIAVHPPSRLSSEPERAGHSRGEGRKRNIGGDAGRVKGFASNSVVLRKFRHTGPDAPISGNAVLFPPAGAQVLALAAEFGGGLAALP
jgi:hypothetical protein